MTDLTAGDFRVFEDSKEQTISLFSSQAQRRGEAIGSLPTVGDAAVTNEISAPGSVRVVLFDRLNTAWTDQEQARRHIIRRQVCIHAAEFYRMHVSDTAARPIRRQFWRMFRRYGRLRVLPN